MFSYIWVSSLLAPHLQSSTEQRIREAGIEGRAPDTSMGKKGMRKQTWHEHRQQSHPYTGTQCALRQKNVIPKSVVRNKMLLRGWTGVCQPSPLPRLPPSLPRFSYPSPVTMATFHQKAQHLQSVEQAACPLEHCEMSRMLFWNGFCSWCVLRGGVWGEGMFWLLICGSAD